MPRFHVILKLSQHLVEIFVEEVVDERTVLASIVDMLFQVGEQVVLPNPTQHLVRKDVHVHPFAITAEQVSDQLT